MVTALNRCFVLIVLAVPTACLAQDRADESPEYYRKYSLQKAYPMGIKIVVYALSQ